MRGLQKRLGARKISIGRPDFTLSLRCSSVISVAQDDHFRSQLDFDSRGQTRYQRRRRRRLFTDIARARAKSCEMDARTLTSSSVLVVVVQGNLRGQSSNVA